MNNEKTKQNLGLIHNHRFHEDERRRGFFDIIPGLGGDMNFTYIPRMNGKYPLHNLKS